MVDIVRITKKQLKFLVENFTSEDFKDVYNTARMAHVGQSRRDGSEYFSHPSEVRNIARRFYPRDSLVQMAALLHDSLEDAPGSTVSSIEEMEDFIKGAIQDQSSAEEVIRVVRALTHEKGGDYTDYVISLMGDVPTLRVKLADMVHNLSDAPRPKQKAKYKMALDAIAGKTGGKPPAGISSEHWGELYRLLGENKNKREPILSESTEALVRKIVREELMKESKPKIPVKISELEFMPDSSGNMSLPKIGASIVVRDQAGFDGWKNEFISKYGDGMISWNYNGWNVENDNFKEAQQKQNKRFMRHHRDMERRLGRKLRY